MLLIETALAILAVLLSLVCPTLGARWFERIESGFSRLANRRGLAVAVIGLSTLILRVAVLPVEPIPQPSVHDEFCLSVAGRYFCPRPFDKSNTSDVGAL